MIHKYFGEILIQEGKINKEQLNKGLNLQKDNSDRKLGEILVTLNFIKYDDIIDTVKKQYKLNGATPSDIDKWLSQSEVDAIIKSMK